MADVQSLDIETDWDLFLSTDRETLRWLRERNRPIKQTPRVLDFRGLLTGTGFASLMRAMLATLSTAYDHPVDIEYTVNLGADGEPRVNLVQCRPLQTRGLGHAVAMPAHPDPARTLFSSHGNFMGGNLRLPLDHVVLVRPDAYLALGQRERHGVARAMGVLNKALAGHSFMIMAAGRWGTTTPSLGIPVHFTEISNAAAIVEFTYPAGGFVPELSQGSHFFQDLVESGIFYAAIFDRQRDVSFAPELVTAAPNQLLRLAPELGGDLQRSLGQPSGEHLHHGRWLGWLQGPAHLARLQQRPDDLAGSGDLVHMHVAAGTRTRRASTPSASPHRSAAGVPHRAGSLHRSQHPTESEGHQWQ